MGQVKDALRQKCQLHTSCFVIQLKKERKDKDGGGGKGEKKILLKFAAHNELAVSFSLKQT